MSGSNLPDTNNEIHPWMPVDLVERSRLGNMCRFLNASIHDREKVYEAMKKVERELNFPAK